MELRKAAREELKHIAEMYAEVKEMPGCTWNEEYPSFFTASEDHKTGGLYVLAEGEQLFGAASLVSENELDDMECWSLKNKKTAEIARVVIAKRYQGKGYSVILLQELLEELKQQGFPAVHLLVAKVNRAAIAAYSKLGFSFVGECFMYDNDFFACEKKL